MLTRTVTASLIATFLLGGSVQANETAEQWLQYLNGNWQRERKITNDTDGAERQQTHQLTRKLVVAGKGLVTEVEGDDGQAHELSIWDGYRQALVTTGINASGISYTLTFDKLDETSLTGSIVGGLPNGTKAEGSIRYQKTDDDTYGVEVDIKLDSGQVIRWTETNTRLKTQQRSLHTDDVNAK